jgi:hypothetical protein
VRWKNKNIKSSIIIEHLDIAVMSDKKLGLKIKLNIHCKKFVDDSYLCNYSTAGRFFIHFSLEKLYLIVIKYLIVKY